MIGISRVFFSTDYHFFSEATVWPRLSFDLDWTNQRLLNIRVDGLLVAEEVDVKFFFF